MLPKLRVYVAGAYTKGDVAINVSAAMAATHQLMDLGFAPFCPHLSHLLHIWRARPYEDWMELDLAWLPVAQAVLRIPGESSGADREVEMAKELGIPVFYDIESLNEWYCTLTHIADAA